MNNSNTLVGFAACLLGASLICFPALGMTGVISALCAIYFGMVLVNSADAAANRKRRQQNRKGR